MYRQHVGSQGGSRVCTRIPAIPGGAVGSAKNTRYMIGGLGAILQRGPHGERTDLDGFPEPAVSATVSAAGSS